MLSESDQADLLMPLQFFYAREERAWPHITFVEPADMPQPQLHLLVHASDMTPRLADFHGDRIALDVLAIEATDLFVMRLVRLKCTLTGCPVEIGAIGIDLSGFEPADADLIRQGKEPLGGILQERSIPHSSSPKGYFKVITDTFLAEILHTKPGVTLYGRCNALSHPDGITFADIVEILPE